MNEGREGHDGIAGRRPPPPPPPLRLPPPTPSPAHPPPRVPFCVAGGARLRRRCLVPALICCIKAVCLASGHCGTRRRRQARRYGRRVCSHWVSLSPNRRAGCWRPVVLGRAQEPHWGRCWEWEGGHPACPLSSRSKALSESQNSACLEKSSHNLS